jgi:pimeloyl-ACP methyl ester carboxylesterase
MWEPLMRHLAPHFRVWAFDLLGFGDTQIAMTDPIVCTVETHTQLLLDAIAALKIQPYAIIGHSMGGTLTLKLALKLASQAPTSLQRIGLICPVVTGQFLFNVGEVLGHPVTTQLAQQIDPVGARIWDSVKQLPGIQNIAVSPHLTGWPKRRAYEDYRKADWRAVIDGFMSLMNIHLETQISQIKLPTLIITGTYDLTVPPKDSRLAAATIPQATFFELANCHHHPTDEEPAITQKIVDLFLRDAPIVFTAEERLRLA